jgi:hypothetical protein
MSFTRFHDDPARIQKQNIETSAMNSYIFNVPGNGSGVQSQYINDPHVRLQKTGMKQQTNMINIESMLRNIHVPLNRDDRNINEYNRNTTHSKGVKTKEHNKSMTDETRTSHPVFEYRERQTHRNHILLRDPQENVFMPFKNNLDTNMLEKDHYNKKMHKKI